MTLQEVKRLFISSRKRGNGGARKAARPKTLVYYTKNLELFLGYMLERGIVDWQSIRRSDFLDFLDFLDKKVEAGEWRPASRLMALVALRTLFNWVERDRDCELEGLKTFKRDMPRIGRSPRKTSIPTIGEMRRFLTSFNTREKWGFRNYVAMCLMMDTGARVGEVCSLTLDHLKLEDKMVLIPEEGKTGARLVQVTYDTVRILKGYLRRRGEYTKAASSPYLFVSRKADRCDPGVFTQVFDRHRTRHGLKHITPHTLRHAFCTYYLRKGGDIKKLKNITGHSSYEVLDGYLHLAEVGGRAAAEELERVSPLKQLTSDEED